MLVKHCIATVREVVHEVFRIAPLLRVNAIFKRFCLIGELKLSVQISSLSLAAFF